MTTETRLHTDLSSGEFERFRDWIHLHSGIYLEDSKIDSLRVSLAERAARAGARDYAEYFRLLSADEQEFKSLLDLVTVNETSFFRFPAQFDALRSHVVPSVLADAPTDRPRRLSVWSAGCSTGEEPYTLAMTMLESGLSATYDHLEVLGTDVSARALEIGGLALYPERSLSTVSHTARERWFEPGPGGGFRPVDAVRRIVRFRYHNLAREAPPSSFAGGFDVIFCRNVTIYFSLESTRQLVDAFFDALNPGGYLFLGHSETLTSVSDRFETIETGGVFLYRKPAKLAKPGVGITEQSAIRLRPRAGESPRGSAGEPGPGGAAERRPVAPREAEPDPLGRARQSLEGARPADALGIARELITADPGNEAARLVMAFAHADLGQLEEAAAQASVALAADPLSAPAHYILGVIKREQGDVDAALAEFRRTLYADRDFVLAHFAIATIERRRANLAEAGREYENTLAALRATPEGSWTAFLGGFSTELLAATCRRGLLACERGATRG